MKLHINLITRKNLRPFIGKTLRFKSIKYLIYVQKLYQYPVVKQSLYRINTFDSLLYQAFLIMTLLHATACLCMIT